MAGFPQRWAVFRRIGAIQYAIDGNRGSQAIRWALTVAIREISGTASKCGCARPRSSLAFFSSSSVTPVKPSFHIRSTRPDSGTMCVAPVPLDLSNKVVGWVPFNPATLSVQIDKKPQMAWPHKAGFKVSSLDLKQRHLVTLISDGKRIQSFWFRFTDFQSTDLCLSCDGFPPELQEARHAPWCGCNWER
jgi:hypothetical protein